MHEEAKIEPLNYEIHRQAEKTFNKMTTLQIPEFTSLIENYEENRTHNWFKKIKKTSFRKVHLEEYIPPNTPKSGQTLIIPTRIK